jgi:hypothetical protein
MKLLSFDIEISDIFEIQPYEDIEKYAPFHISVASTVVYDGEEQLWYSKDTVGKPLLNLDKNKALELLLYLQNMQKRGLMVCAWNGLQFDLRWIGFAAADMELAAQVALKTYDPMFQFFNQRGFPVSLAAVGKSMGVKQEKLMHGSEAPIMWKKGCYQEVMDYVLMDSRITNEIILAIANRAEVCWTTKTNIMRCEPMPELKNVETVLNDPMADQSWMDNPIPKSNFYRWFPEHIWPNKKKAGS